MNRLALIFILFTVLSKTQYVPDPSTWRPIDGYGHNPYNVYWGTPGTGLLRKGPAVFADGISTPRTAKISGNPLPSPRAVSNAVFNLFTTNPRSRRGFTDLLTYWGQFIDHDFSFTSGDPNGLATPLRSMPIQVPRGDVEFDPNNLGNVTLPFWRGVFDNTTGFSRNSPWTPVNLVTSWFDGSNVYGHDEYTANYLKGDRGKLKTFMYNNEEYPVFNDGGLVMQSAGIANQTSLLIFGDVRGNENPGLLCLQILFVREHNRLARKYAEEYPTWSDEEIYQESRKMVIAFMQHITEEEYLPLTIGEHVIEFEELQLDASPNIFSDFSTGAFRYGHSEVNSHFLRLDSNNQSIPEGPLSLMDSYFNPNASIFSAGIDPIIRGMAQQVQGAVDTVFVTDLRNYLFPNKPGIPSLDLVAINTQRGRDHGLPGINAFRYNYNLPPYTEWEQINPDPIVYNALKSVYESIDDCDVYVCGLAEPPFGDLSNVGETFLAAIRDQYYKLRDGDSAWYEADDYLTDEQEDEARDTFLSDIIIRNTNIKENEIQCFAMASPDGCGLPVTPPTVKYDFLVTVVETSPDNPYAGRENRYSLAIDGVDAAHLILERGRNYTFFAQVSCNHPFFIANTIDYEDPPFATPYAPVANQHACFNDEPIVILTIDDNTPTELFYACSFHNWMGGNITIPRSPSPSSVEVDYHSITIGLGVAVGVLGIIVFIFIIVFLGKNRMREGYEEVKLK